jgi:hypothetical protein
MLSAECRASFKTTREKDTKIEIIFILCLNKAEGKQGVKSESKNEPVTQN